MMKGIRRIFLLPYADAIIVTARVTRAQIRQTYGEATPVPLLVISPTAFLASERPMIVTVGPITTVGMILLIHATPQSLTIRAMIT